MKLSFKTAKIDICLPQPTIYGTVANIKKSQFLWSGVPSTLSSLPSASITTMHRLLHTHHAEDNRVQIIQLVFSGTKLTHTVYPEWLQCFSQKLSQSKVWYGLSFPAVEEAECFPADSEKLHFVILLNSSKMLNHLILKLLHDCLIMSQFCVK